MTKATSIRLLALAMIFIGLFLTMWFITAPRTIQTSSGIRFVDYISLPFYIGVVLIISGIILGVVARKHR